MPRPKPHRRPRGGCSRLDGDARRRRRRASRRRRLGRRRTARPAGRDGRRPTHLERPQLRPRGAVRPRPDGRHPSTASRRPALSASSAPELLLERGHVASELRDDLERRLDRWASKGLRVLAVAERRVDTAPEEASLDDEVELVGLVALGDPLRPTARESLHRARDAGIDVVRTDHPLTATAIAQALDLAGGEPLTGPELAALDDDALRATVAGRDVSRGSRPRTSCVSSGRGSRVGTSSR